MSDSENSLIKDHVFADASHWVTPTRPVAAVVFTRNAELRTKARQTQFGHLGFGHLQSFHTVTHHRRGDVGSAVDFLRGFAASAASIAA